MTERVLIADDHPIFRRGLREVLEAHKRFQVIAEAGDGAAALQLIREHRPTLAVLDLAMPEADGFDVLAQASRWPDAPAFVLLTMYDERAYCRRAFELGALGYLLKENAEDELVQCLKAVASGRQYIGSGMPWRAASDGTLVEAPNPMESLTPAERRVLKLVAECKSSRQIAKLLNVSIRTVDNHRAHITQKLGLSGPNALLRFALDHGDTLEGGSP